MIFSFRIGHYGQSAMSGKRLASSMHLVNSRPIGSFKVTVVIYSLSFVLGTCNVDQDLYSHDLRVDTSTGSISITLLLSILTLCPVATCGNLSMNSSNYDCFMRVFVALPCDQRKERDILILWNNICFNIKL